MKSKGYIPPAFIERLLLRVNIVEVIGNRLILKKAGVHYKACCPFHQEKTPSFVVNENKQFYHCFGCGASGNAVQFIMAYEQCDFIEAIEVLAQMEGMNVPYEQSDQPQTAENQDKTTRLLEWVEWANQFFMQQLRVHPERERAVAYLKQRGMSGEIAKRFSIGYAPNEWHMLRDFLLQKGATISELLASGLITQNDKKSTYDRFRDRIIFPIRNRQGKVLAFGGRILDQGEPKYLNSPETEFFHKGQMLYGLYEVRTHSRYIDEIIVVEGYMDVVMLANFDINNVVATLGTATSTTQVEHLLRQVKRVIFCFDGDRAGKEAAWKALQASLPVLTTGKTVAFLFLPDGEDPDSFVRTQGKQAFSSLLSEAKGFSEYLFDYLQTEIAEEHLGQIEANALLLERASELIQKMPDSTLRDFLRDELVKKTQASNDLLRKKGLGVTPNKTARRSTQVAALPITKRTPVQRLIALLLNNPQLAMQTSLANLPDASISGIELLKELITLIQDKHWQHAGQILGHYQMQPVYAHLTKLARLEVIDDEALQYNEWQELLQRLTQQVDPRKIALEKLAKGETLTSEEIARIQGNIIQQPENES